VASPLTWQGDRGEAADQRVFDGQQVLVQGLRALLVVAQLRLQTVLGAAHVLDVTLQRGILLLKLHVGLAQPA